MRKAFSTIILITLVFTLIGCGTKTSTDEDLAQTYHQMVLTDFKSQEILADEEAADKLLRQIYIEPALSEHMEGLQLMRANNIKRIYHNPKFTSIKVLQNDGNLAVLQVEGVFQGEELSITQPAKNLEPFIFDYSAEITLKKVKSKWYISMMNSSVN